MIREQSIGLVEQRYRDALESCRVYRVQRYDILIRSLWIASLVTAAALVLSPENTTRTLFYLAFLGALPIVMLVGFLTWADTVFSMSMAELDLYFLRRQFLGLQWPDLLEQIRQEGELRVGRNRYGVYAGPLVFLGTTLGSVGQALLRGTSFPSDGALIDAALISLAATCLSLQIIAVGHIALELRTIARMRSKLSREIGSNYEQG